MFDQYFYHGTSRRYAAVFGGLFSKIKIKNGDKTIPVPLTYGKGDQNYEHSKGGGATTNKKKANQLPRMSFEVGLPVHDEARQENKNNYIHGVGGAMYNRVPYNYNFTLNIKVRNVDDLYQVAEQILPFFQPYIQVSMVDCDDFGSPVDVSIHLDSSDGDIDYTEKGREITAVLQFTLKGFLYKPTKTVVPITEIDLTFLPDDGTFERLNFSLDGEQNVVTVTESGDV